MSRTLRYLRIAFSFICGIACVLLVVLWVRTFLLVDTIKPFAHDEIFIVTEPGAFGIAAMPSSYGAWWSSEPTPEWIKEREGTVKSYSPLLGTFEVSPCGFLLPFWFVVLLMTTLSAAPLISWSRRFSLRTLLIATTLFGLILGTIIATTR